MYLPFMLHELVKTYLQNEEQIIRLVIPIWYIYDQCIFAEAKYKGYIFQLT